MKESRQRTPWMHEPVQSEDEFDFGASMARFNKQEFTESMKVRSPVKLHFFLS